MKKTGEIIFLGAAFLDLVATAPLDFEKTQQVRNHGIMLVCNVHVLVYGMLLLCSILVIM